MDVELKLTKEEAQLLYELISLAGSHGGPPVWKSAMPIIDKLMESAKKVSHQEDE